jgi:3-phenylpropionate/cinnamic acid dioxygenase small subunit
MSTTASTMAVMGETLGARVPFADPVYGEVVDFLTEEAALLDHDLQHEWLERVAEDVMYKMPARETRYRADGSGIDTRGGLFSDNHYALTMRVKRNMDVVYAFDREPPPRIRRLVTNISVYRTDNDEEFRVNSYIVLLRNQFDLVAVDLVSGERQDVLRKTEDGWKLARRTILVDMCTLPDPFPNILL